MTNRRDIYLNLSLIFIGILLAWAGSEIVIRWTGWYDVDRQFVTLTDMVLKPYKLPIARTQEKVAEYFQRGDNTAIMYHPALGWVPRPNGQSDDKLYRYNSQGIRAERDYTLQPSANTLRIAMFGDSFTHGSDVPFEESWGYLLEQHLHQTGLPAEVLNFGVSGYGMDQAFIRWQEEGQLFQPDIVIFGLQPENIKRNLNLIRVIYRRGDIPFSKPRFILTANGLQPLNQPTLPPEQVPQMLKTIDDWSLVSYEQFYNSADYQLKFWLRSKAISLMLTYFAPSNDVSYALADEPTQLALRIIEQFQQSVVATGADFVIVLLLKPSDLEDWVAGESLLYKELLTEVEQRYNLIWPGIDRLPEARQLSLDPLFQKNHYSLQGNAIVAEAILPHILEKFAPK